MSQPEPGQRSANTAATASANPPAGFVRGPHWALLAQVWLKPSSGVSGQPHHGTKGLRSYAKRGPARGHLLQ